MKTKHDSDCHIFSELANGLPYDGICTCGYGLQQIRDGRPEHEVMTTGLRDALDMGSVEIEAKAARLDAVVEKAQHYIDSADMCFDIKPEDRTKEDDVHAVGVKSTALDLLRIAKGESDG